MARPLRIQYPGAVYHVMNRGGARQRVFGEDADRARFLGVLEDTHRRWGVRVYAYCLLGTHYHLCLQTPEGNLARVMRHLDGVYTQRFNRAHRRDGPLFRGRYRAILIDADAYLAAVVRYIHLNPVEAGLVEDPGAYPWSSHRSYLRPQKAPPWLEVGALLDRDRTPQQFHQFVLAGNEEALKRYYRSQRPSPLLGGEGFLRWLEGLKLRPLHEHPRYERRGVRPSLAQLVERVARSYRIPPERIYRGRRGEANEARQVAMLLAQEVGDLTLGQIGEAFGVRAGTVGCTGWKWRQVLQKHRRLAQRYAALVANR